MIERWKKIVGPTLGLSIVTPTAVPPTFDSLLKFERVPVSPKLSGILSESGHPVEEQPSNRHLQERYATRTVSGDFASSSSGNVYTYPFRGTTEYGSFRAVLDSEGVIIAVHL